MNRLGFFAASAGGLIRPTLLGSNNGGVTGSSTISFSCSVPAACNLAVAVFVDRNAANTRTLSSITLGGNSLTALQAYAQNTKRTGGGIYYLVNPPTGTQTFSLSLSGSMNSGLVTVFFFEGNTTTPFIQSASDHSVTSGTSVSQTLNISQDLSYIVAGASKANIVSSNIWTLTNLTEKDKYNNGSTNGFVTAYNDTIAAPGNTAFTLQCSGSSSYLSGVWAQLAPIGL